MIPDCCLRSLLPFWPLCVQVAQTLRTKRITPELLWVLLWTENPVCRSEYPLYRVGPREAAHVHTLAAELRALLSSYRSLDRALLAHRFGPAALTGRPSTPWAQTDLGQRYLDTVFDTLRWAGQDTPWQPPRPKSPGRPQCGKPLPSHVWPRGQKTAPAHGPKRGGPPHGTD
jgi:hypothetical protein